MQLKMEFAFSEVPKDEYSSSDDEFVVEKEEDGALLLYGDDNVDPIFFEDSENFDEVLKVDGDGRDFVEDDLVFKKTTFVIEVVFYSKSPQVLEEVNDLRVTDIDITERETELKRVLGQLASEVRRTIESGEDDILAGWNDLRLGNAREGNGGYKFSLIGRRARTSCAFFFVRRLGTGKTSTILAVARKLYGRRFHNMITELNASDDRGINVVRAADPGLREHAELLVWGGE
ncbi:hypothetical protein Scep_012163 [Stephania cephalantha]|uniref:Uncharacterized protein n=1 Tax=Stephania cephalantha TaxID=152367 RepID=A0AAP0JFI3_9MAGN